jgi:hypothetical protein
MGTNNPPTIAAIVSIGAIPKLIKNFENPSKITMYQATPMPKTFKRSYEKNLTSLLSIAHPF